MATHASFLMRSIGQIESHLKGQSESMIEIKIRMGKLEKRLVCLERQTYLWRSSISFLVGMATFLGTVFPYLWDFLLKK